MTIATGRETRLDLPLRPVPDGEIEIHFDEPETAAPVAVDRVQAPERDWTIAFDPITGRQTITVDDQQAKRFVDQDLEISATNRIEWSIRDGYPRSAMNAVENSWRARRKGWDVRVETRSTLSADAECFHLTTLVEAFEGDTRVRTKSHSARIPRDNV